MIYKIWCILLLSGLVFTAAAQNTDTLPVPAVAGEPTIEGPPRPATAPGYERVDQEPEFPGGQRALMTYLSRSLRYPEKAMAGGVEGKVLVQFVVCENGTLCEEKVVRRLGSGCDEEVIRVVKAMPVWKPAQKDGKAVRRTYRLPVQFKFADEEPKGKQ